MSNYPPPINDNLLQAKNSIIQSPAWLLWLQKVGGFKPEFYADQFTLDMTVGGVTHTISSIGFQPSAMICLATMDGGGVPASFGFATYSERHGRDEMSLYSTHATAAGTWASNTYLATFVQGIGVIGYCHTWTPGPDSMQFTYDKIGAPVGTAVINCFIIK